MVGETMNKYPTGNDYDLGKKEGIGYQGQSFSFDPVKPLESKLSSVLSLTESEEHRQAMKDLFTTKHDSNILTRRKMSQKLNVSDENLDWRLPVDDLLPPNRLEPLGQRRRGSMPAVLPSTSDKPSLLTRQRLSQHNSLMLPKISENGVPRAESIISGQTNLTLSSSLRSSILREEYLTRRNHRRKSFSCSRSDASSVVSLDLTSEKRKRRQKWRKMIHKRRPNLFAKKESSTKLPKLT